MQTLKKCLQKVLFNSIKREERYYEFKLDVYKQETNRKQTDLVPEVAPPEVGHLKTEQSFYMGTGNGESRQGYK